MSKKPVARKPDPSTTGHEWDGIREFDNPMPRWWLWTFYLTIIWGIGYTVLYPAWPLVNGVTHGLWGFSTRQEVAADIKAFADRNAPIEAKLVATNLTDIAKDPDLANYTQNAGHAIFLTWCAQCHGAGAGGAKGFPNLLDNDWLWGGTIDNIHTTITHGIRNTTDPDARFSQMPAFGEILTPEEIDQVANHVLAISGQPNDAGLAAAGTKIFADNCASCHGEDGKGNREFGAPNLTDAIWLYGGDPATIKETVTKARFGVMPAWQGRLTEAQIRAVASYVHGLGGGE
ncbi:MAG: cytochrome-c oxidase, cbb3-type subunit III [Proteobacteria bacterium]|nr:cytochrome-c oxidase, cbb3-type subunit III [Pseudomonadota bacterium]MBS0574757.1 cytochrome-c oxidase, cbb3-type subunit III [Pseudomonadota bacterium]